MRILVVGGAGYIGSVMVEELVKGGDEVIIYDNLSRGHREALTPGATFVEGDLGDRSRVEEALRRHQVEAIMHFAAFALVGESMAHPEMYFENNVANTINLLSAALTVGVKKFVFSSSAATYGEPEHVPIAEADRQVPTNPYGQTKLMVEQILDWYATLSGLRYAALRYFNAAGASDLHGEDHDPETHLIPIVLQAALGIRDHVEIFGVDYPTPDGTCLRDYVHVIDLAQAHILALKALERQERLAFNLGNGNGFSVREVIETARRVTGREIKAVESPRRPGDPAALVASSERIKSELGWAPRHAALEDIVETAWRWHRKHPRGYGRQP
jgi:UDP-glucose 4-epimerase